MPSHFKKDAIFALLHRKLTSFVFGFKVVAFSVGKVMISTGGSVDVIETAGFSVGLTGSGFVVAGITGGGIVGTTGGGFVGMIGSTGFTVVEISSSGLGVEGMNLVPSFANRIEVKVVDCNVRVHRFFHSESDRERRCDLCQPSYVHLLPLAWFVL